ncbi:hypothetical protein CC1G_04464 [Coprinopsis cinerea okayama7|uniref:Homeobox domain-containing protein n=1 Tax=Coprinopsis cinerea (strain Okayama-7 / 130 / ATCC MYA-4618 / FGSC 9003) TaxID=240176 RepID=A8N582_COPC7|nr:hypothetical protein CC1G_04464 [Coprinopsis cinerea okayama7\|eukprot:XP_001830031.2 hypothetical protein CC1G_04464 [Coprinopsis cinerea okayama7\
MAYQAANNTSSGGVHMGPLAQAQTASIILQERHFEVTKTDARAAEFEHVNGLYPTRVECDDLLERIRAVGNAHYQFHTLKGWFNNRRALRKREQAQSQGAVAHSTSDALPAPSTHLNKSQMAQLRIMAEPIPGMPPESTIAIWANLLRVEKDVVHAFLRDIRRKATSPESEMAVDDDDDAYQGTRPPSPHTYQRPSQPLKIEPSLHQQRLPTPAETASPGPSISSPVISHTDERFSPDVKPHSRSSSLMSPLGQFPGSASLPPTAVLPDFIPTHVQRHEAPPQKDIVLEAIKLGVLEGAAAPPKSEPPPRSLAEFDTLWAPFETTLANIAQALSQ